MATRVGVPPLIAIVGPTASGKTALAIKVAQQFNGEVICADSRTIYKGMDIGTAKPTADEQRVVPHWGLDLVEPGESFTVADFKRYAEQKIVEIRARERIPILVGGTGLYIDAIVFDYHFGLVGDDARRQRLAGMELEELWMYCTSNNIQLPENRLNKRYVIRAIEQSGINQQRRSEPIDNCIVVGIATEKTILKQRIADRAEQILTNGIVEEATILGKKYGWESEAMTGNIYPLIKSYLEKGLSAQSVAEKFTTLDWRLAKRQLTWFRRNPFIVWCTREHAESYLRQLLANS